MNLPFSQKTPPEEYMNFVEQFVDLADQEFKKWEEFSKKEENLNILTKKIPALITLVNTIGFFRGQDSIFTDFRPNTERQKDLYAFEMSFEDRLEKLMEIILKSKEKDFLKEWMEFKFIQSRIQ